MTSLALLSTLVMAQGTVPVTRVQTYVNVKGIAIAAAPTGTKFAVSMSNSSIRLIDAKYPSWTVTLTGHPQPAFAVAFNNTGTQVVSGDESGRIFVWDVKTGKKLREFPRNAQTHVRGIQHIAFSPDGKILLTTGKDDAAILWDFANAKPLRKLSGNGAIFSSAQFATSKQLVYGTVTEGLHMRKYPGLDLTVKKNVHNGQGIQDLALDKTGTRLVTGGRDGKLGLWDAKNGKMITSMGGHSFWVQHIAISPDGKYAATSSNDRMVLVWDLGARKQLAKLDQMYSLGSPLAFSGDGKYMMAVNVNEQAQLYKIGK